MSGRAEDDALREVIFQALVELEGRQKQHNGYVVADGLIEALSAAGFKVVPESFVTSVLYSGAFEGEDLQKLYAEAEALLGVHRNGFSDAEAAIAISRIVRSTCSECGGHGWIRVPEHGCGGDERLCAEMCPEPVQVPCPSCREPVRPTPSDEEPF